MNIQFTPIKSACRWTERIVYFIADCQKEGMVKVVGISPEEMVAGNIELLLDAKSEVAAGGRYHFIKNRIIQGKELTFCSMDVTFLAEVHPEENRTANKAKIFLLPKELPCFSIALWQHPIPFPTNISQVQTVGHHGMTCLQLETVEPLENFVKRLSGALKAIEELMAEKKSKALSR